MLRGFRLDCRRLDTQATHVAVIGIDVSGRHSLPGNFEFIGAIDDLVVHVRKVFHEGDRQTAVLEIPADHVEDQRAARVAEMAFVVDGHAADVHLDLAGLERLEGLLFPGQRIVDLQHKNSLSGLFSCSGFSG